MSFSQSHGHNGNDERDAKRQRRQDHRHDAVHDAVEKACCEAWGGDDKDRSHDQTRCSESSGLDGKHDGHDDQTLSREHDDFRKFMLMMIELMD